MKRGSMGSYAPYINKNRGSFRKQFSIDKKSNSGPNGNSKQINKAP